MGPKFSDLGKSIFWELRAVNLISLRSFVANCHYEDAEPGQRDFTRSSAKVSIKCFIMHVGVCSHGQLCSTRDRQEARRDIVKDVGLLDLL